MKKDTYANTEDVGSTQTTVPSPWSVPLYGLEGGVGHGAEGLYIM